MSAPTPADPAPEPLAEPAPEPAPAPGDPQTPGPAAPSVSTAVPPTCPTRTRLYRSGELLQEGFPAEDIRGLLDADQDAVVWLDLYEPTESDLSIVTEEFGLHPLAVEDAITTHQRPKVDRYRTHLFANMYTVAIADRSTVRSGEISVFITPRALITVRKDDFDIDTLIARWDLNADLVTPGNEIAVLTYGLVDAVVDGHYRAVEELDDRAEDLQRYLFDQQTDVDVRREGYELGSALADLRRVVAPMQEVVGRLVRGDSHVVDEHLEPYFRDVADHTRLAHEALEAARERVARVVETQLNEQGAQLNNITRKLAAWAAIIAVPTAVTGFYGQNVPFPGDGQLWGWITSTTVMVVLAAGLYVLLRRNRWL
jgi:magnesium transporter